MLWGNVGPGARSRCVLAGLMPARGGHRRLCPHPCLAVACGVLVMAAGGAQPQHDAQQPTVANQPDVAMVSEWRLTWPASQSGRERDTEANKVDTVVVGAAANNDDEFGSELMAKAMHALKRKERARAER